MRIKTRHHDLSAWFAETRRTVPPEAWQTAFAELMADWKRQGRLPTRQSVERFLGWLSQQQQLALSEPAAATRAPSSSVDQLAGLPLAQSDPDAVARALLLMGPPGTVQPPVDAPSDEDGVDEGPPPQREEVQPSAKEVLQEFLKLVNEIREAKADFETDPGKMIALLRRVVNGLREAIRAVVSREVLSDEALDEAIGILNDALDLLDAIPPEAISAGLDALQLALDVVGLIPGVGELADLVNLAISAKRGQFLDVGLGALSLIPFVGILPGLAKISTRTRRLKRAIDVLSGPLRRLFSGLAEAVSRIGRGARPSNIRDAIRKLREELKRVTEGVRDATKRQADEAAEGAGRRADEGAEAAAEGARQMGKPRLSTSGKIKSKFDLETPRASAAQMRDAVRKLDEAGLSARAVKLTPDEIGGLTENARLVAKKYWDGKAAGTARTVESLQRQFNRPRWKFLDQAGEARRILEEVAEDTGLSL